MAGLFSNIMPMADQLAEDGQSSANKSFSGIAALAAVHDGLFRLDDPVSDTITEWRNDPRKSRITIRQLLSQTRGQDRRRFASSAPIDTPSKCNGDPIANSC